MKISVITVNYNGSKTLSRTIESVLNQTYNNIEYIIIDGKSTDNSTEIIKSYEKKFKEKKYEYKWISEKDTGTYNAMNKPAHLKRMQKPINTYVPYIKIHKKEYGSEDSTTLNILI